MVTKSERRVRYGECKFRWDIELRIAIQRAAKFFVCFPGKKKPEVSISPFEGYFFIPIVFNLPSLAQRAFNAFSKIVYQQLHFNLYLLINKRIT